MYLWGCKCFNHKYIAFWRQLITSSLSEEIIWIPPFSPLLVRAVWEFVFSICPWSECRQQKNGVEQTADAVDGARPGLCSQAARGSSRGGMCELCCSWHRWSCANATETSQLQRAQRHTHTLLQLSTEGLQHVVGLGKARKFSAENSVDWTLLTATSQKMPSVATATCPFFAVAIESQHFCRDLHSKSSDWICVFKLSRRTWLYCGKSHHLPSPDNLLSFQFWPSDYGSFLVCFELTGKVSTYWIN